MLNIRKATPDDIPGIAQLRLTEWGELQYWISRIASYLSGEANPQKALASRFCFVAADGDTVVGFIAGHLTRRYDCDGELQWINVAPERRRQNIASQLLIHAVRWFTTNGAARVCVDVDPENPGARSFYRRHRAVVLNRHWLVWPDIAILLSSSQMSQVLDGKWVRDQIQEEWKPRAAALKRPAGLAVVLVGNDPASEIYVRNKEKACQELGIFSEKLTPPDTITTEELLGIIRSLNDRPDIDGILVQMPLPRQVDSRAVLLAIRPDKDVDGFHPMNVGNLVANIPGPRPCTPAGVMELLRRYQIPVAGKQAVVIGRSDIVGKPMALMLLHEHATVTIAHSKTPNLASECRRADILVAAIGRPAFVTREFIQPGAVVIDVGINRLTPEEQAAVFGTAKPGGAKPRTVIGDVHPLEVAEVAAAYTPVPGGVGPLTIAMLMVNTIRSAEAHQQG